jgi:hypothetical protein
VFSSASLAGSCSLFERIDPVASSAHYSVLSHTSAGRNLTLFPIQTTRFDSRILRPALSYSPVLCCPSSSHDDG